LGTIPQRISAGGAYVSSGNRRLGYENERNAKRGEKDMLKWAATFLVIAIIAALLGFTGIAGAAADIARVLFFLFIAIFVIIAVMALFTGKKLGL
jgi:uncharacterized membrane protein YtjA (UPF0391 family)